MTKQLKCYYLLLIRYYKLSLLNQFLEGYSIMAAWGNNFFKTIFFLLFFHFSAPLKCHWPIRASSLKSHSPAGRIYSPLATGRVLMKRLNVGQRMHDFFSFKISGSKGFTMWLVGVKQTRLPRAFSRPEADVLLPFYSLTLSFSVSHPHLFALSVSPSQPFSLSHSFILSFSPSYCYSFTRSPFHSLFNSPLYSIIFLIFHSLISPFHSVPFNLSLSLPSTISHTHTHTHTLSLSLFLPFTLSYIHPFHFVIPLSFHHLNFQPFTLSLCHLSFSLLTFTLSLSISHLFILISLIVLWPSHLSLSNFHPFAPSLSHFFFFYPFTPLPFIFPLFHSFSLHPLAPYCWKEACMVSPQPLSARVWEECKKVQTNLIIWVPPWGHYSN